MSRPGVAEAVLLFWVSHHNFPSAVPQGPTQPQVEFPPEAHVGGEPPAPCPLPPTLQWLTARQGGPSVRPTSPSVRPRSPSVRPGSPSASGTGWGGGSGLLAGPRSPSGGRWGFGGEQQQWAGHQLREPLIAPAMLNAYAHVAVATSVAAALSPHPPHSLHAQLHAHHQAQQQGDGARWSASGKWSEGQLHVPQVSRSSPVCKSFQIPFPNNEERLMAHWKAHNEIVMAAVRLNDILNV